MTIDEIIDGFQGTHQDIIIYLLHKICYTALPKNNIVNTDEEVLLYSYSPIWREIHYYLLYEIGSYTEIQLYVHNNVVLDRKSLLRNSYGKRKFYDKILKRIDAGPPTIIYLEPIPMIV